MVLVESMSPDGNTDISASVGVAILTYNARKHLPHCLPHIINSPLRPRVLVVDSSSADGTVQIAEQMGAETLVIPRNKLNHGLTREKARKHLNTEIAVMMTPDAYPTDEGLLNRLIAPVAKGIVSATYARQIPHDDADIFEAFPRYFNYPVEGHVRSLNDLGRLGVLTFFFSDSCAAYNNHALDEIGGFPSVLMAEDAITVARLLRRGYRVAYVSDAVVKHSHRYTLRAEFRRYFDTGYVRKIYDDILTADETDYDRGWLFFRALVRELCRRRSVHLIPYAVLQTCAKVAGYRLGRLGPHLPVSLKRRLSSQDFYWTSEAFRELGI
jgi:rhamnosyltransferase